MESYRKTLALARLVAPMFVIALSVIVHGQVQTSAPKATDDPTTGSINGKVVTENGQPVAGATVILRAAGSSSIGRTTATDAEGSFQANNLEAGLYTIFANAPSYTTAFSDQNTSGSFYRIGDSVKLEVVRGGVITGVVTNALGEPVIAVRVRAMMVRDAKGQPAKIAAFGIGDQPTDDRGVYRMYGLPPGTYLVSAGGFGVSTGFQFNPYDSDIPTYAPSSTRDNAAEVTVRSGEESNADIRYRAEAGHSVSGSVKIGGTGVASIMLTPAGGGLMPVATTIQPPGARGFAFGGVSDGDYDLVAQEVNATQNVDTPTIALSEPKRVTVKGASVTGIELVPKPLSRISGRVTLESSKVTECQGKRPPLLAETIVRLRRPEKEDNENLQYVRMFGGSGSPDANGAFVIPNVSPGKYQFEPRFYARYWYLQSITLGGSATALKSSTSPGRIDAAATWTALKSGEQITNLTINLAEGAASIRGRLANAEFPAGMIVYLVPSQDKAEDVLRYFITEIAADGTFALNNLPPGRYFALPQNPVDGEIATLIKLRQPEAAAARAKLRRTAETHKAEIELKPCQNLTDYQLKQ